MRARQTTSELKMSARDSTASATRALEWPANPAKNLMPTSTGFTTRPSKGERSPRCNRLLATAQTNSPKLKNEVIKDLQVTIPGAVCNCRGAQNQELSRDESNGYETNSKRRTLRSFERFFTGQRNRAEGGQL